MATFNASLQTWISADGLDVATLEPGDLIRLTDGTLVGIVAIREGTPTLTARGISDNEYDIPFSDVNTLVQFR